MPIACMQTDVLLFTVQDQYGTNDGHSSPVIANQGVNAGFLGNSSRLDSHRLDDEDEFQDALETPAESFSTNNAAYGSAPTSSTRQPYVNQTGPPLVENDPDETFGPVKQQNRAQPAPQPAQSQRDTVGFDDSEEYETDADGKRGVRSRLKDKVGAKREHHHEKKREQADHQLEQKMQEKELSKTNAVTVSNLFM